MTGYKAFTHDLRSPIQGGDPVWDGALPYTLPKVRVDRGPDDCGRGWNFCRSPATTLRIAGLWPDGRPVRLFEVDTGSENVTERKDKCRVATATLTRELGPDDVRAAILDLSQVFGNHADDMAAEQFAWWQALGRPNHDPERVRLGLDAALEARQLSSWTLKEFASNRAARAARAAWAAWDAWDAWDARAAWDAWDALTVGFASRQGWIQHKPGLLTDGLRDAYTAGLGIALPTGQNELGWAMDDPARPGE